ncbi:MAG TPA: hypothetical protein VFN94_04465 [Nitrospiria bacterium]|nr:hypothetical protein [Nitrospiria bacterium]
MALAAETTARAKPGDRKGRGFFLTLIIASGLVILGLAFVYFKGKDFFIFTWQKFVIEKALVRALPPDYSVEQVEDIRRALIDFYAAGGRHEISDEALYGMSQGIKTILADQVVTKQEAEALMAFIREHGPKTEGATAP